MYRGILIVLFSFLLGETYSQRPNIILIIADDVSWDDIGCYGNKYVHTPNLDRIAKEGIRFTNAFVTSSSCSPSRSSIITGRYPHNTGAAELHTALPAHLTYFPELLKKSGYYTAQAGKWHEGANTKRAYDTLIAGDINGAGGEEQWLRLLKERPADKPFFLWLAPYDAHREWQEDPERPAHKLSDVTIPPALLDTKETREDLVAYYNEIARLDAWIGKLEKELISQKLDKNTMIVFMSDNGRPFPGSKTRLYDSGVKTPFIIKWPKGISKPGSECKSLISSIDIAPTLLRLANVDVAESIQGKSFDALLKSPTTAFRNYVFTEHNWHDYEACERGVRTKEYLYILNAKPWLANQGPLDAVNSPSFKALLKAKEDGKLLTPLQQDLFRSPRPQEELFEVVIDPQQQINLINQSLEQLARLRMILQQWKDETGDSFPYEKATKDWYGRVKGEILPDKDKRGEMPGAAKGADKVNNKGPF
jgi:N-sulfoglucosamine sulfohydrolase